MVTFCTLRSLIVSGLDICADWSRPANTFQSLYTSCRWGTIKPGEWGNTTRCKEWFWNGAQLNCSHMMSKSESHSKIRQHYPCVPGFHLLGPLVNLSSSRNLGMPTGNSLVVYVSLAVPEHTHIGICPNKGRHATWHMSYSQHWDESHRDTHSQMDFGFKS